MRYYMIYTENLSRSYGNRRGIENLVIEVEPGEVFGILGSKGAGKTTIFKLLLGKIHPTSGNIKVLGKNPVFQKTNKTITIGYTPIHFGINQFLSIHQYLDHIAAQKKNSKESRHQELLNSFNLDPKAKIFTLNQSEKTKLSLIQAFMFRPELVICDEPLEFLDTEAQDIFYKLVSEARAEGRSVVFTSTQLSEMERICDRAAILHEGKLIATERGIQLRARAFRKVELRFSSSVSLEQFKDIPNLYDLRLEDNKMRCTIYGDPDALIKKASQLKVTDIISLRPSIEEAYKVYYGLIPDQARG